MVTPPNQYSTIDPVIQRWSAQHDLHVSTRYRDEEVRVASVVDDAGDTYRIAVTPIADVVAVDTTLDHRASRRVSSQERKQFVFAQRVESAQLPTALETAFERIRSWIAQAGHTRTPGWCHHLIGRRSEPRASVRLTLCMVAIHTSAAWPALPGSRLLILCLVRC